MSHRRIYELTSHDLHDSVSWYCIKNLICSLSQKRSKTIPMLSIKQNPSSVSSSSRLCNVSAVLRLYVNMRLSIVDFLRIHTYYRNVNRAKSGIVSVIRHPGPIRTNQELLSGQDYSISQTCNTLLSVPWTVCFILFPLFSVIPPHIPYET